MKNLFVTVLLLPVLIIAASLACRMQAPPETPTTQANDAPAPISIAVVPFRLASGTPPPPFDVADLIGGDLAATGRFAPMTSADRPSRPTALADIQFEQWRRAKTDFVVVGLVAIVHDDGHEVEFRLVDTREERPVVEFVVPSAPGGLKDTARKIARIIDQRLNASRDAKRDV